MSSQDTSAPRSPHAGPLLKPSGSFQQKLIARWLPVGSVTILRENDEEVASLREKARLYSRILNASAIEEVNRFGFGGQGCGTGPMTRLSQSASSSLPISDHRFQVSKSARSVCSTLILFFGLFIVSAVQQFRKPGRKVPKGTSAGYSLSLSQTHSRESQAAIYSTWGSHLSKKFSAEPAESSMYSRFSWVGSDPKLVIPILSV